MASKTSKKVLGRLRRQRAVRKRVKGSPERPRLSVFRSTRHVYAQVIDDTTGKTLAALSTLHAELKGEFAGKKKREQAKLLGAAIGKLCQEKEIAQVVFDRNGFTYHGRIQAVADGAREAGLVF